MAKFIARAEFDALVENAIEFVESAIEAIEKRPKNTIVDMHTAVELFLKARLMKEHWSLIVTGAKVDTNKFKAGDFISVTFAECCARLKDIAQAPIPRAAETNFDELRKHRNRIVHFANFDLLVEGDARAKIFTELWASWRHLYQLLTGVWVEHFANVHHRIVALDRSISRLSAYLKSSYDGLRPEIERRKEQGQEVLPCKTCRYESVFLSRKVAWGDEFGCLVCKEQTTRTSLANCTIPCPSCGKETSFLKQIFTTHYDHSVQQASCEHCSHNITLEDLKSACSIKYGEGDSWCEEEGVPHIATCHKCDDDPASTFFIDGQWTCITCFERGYSALHCESCDLFATTADPKIMEYVGCHRCLELSAANARHALEDDLPEFDNWRV